MTDQTAQEPTMEEILASIRRIISEDDAPAETAEGAEPAEEPVPDAAAEAEAAEPTAKAEPADGDDDEDVLELTDRYDKASAEAIGDLDVVEPESAAAEPEPEPEPFPVEAEQPEPEPEPDPEPAQAEPAAAYDPIVGDTAAASAASAFAGLAASMRPSDPGPASVSGGATIDDLVRSLLRPLLKEWLDANLPGIVQTEVRKEVERIARDAG